MNVVQPGGGDNIQFISTPTSTSSETKDLLRLAYTRVQKESPDFTSKYEGIDQNVDIKMSTLVFRAAPEPVLSLYDFIMTTFVTNPGSTSPPTKTEIPSSDAIEQDQFAQNADGKIRVIVKLDGVRGVHYHSSLLFRFLTSP